MTKKLYGRCYLYHYGTLRQNFTMDFPGVMASKTKCYAGVGKYTLSVSMLHRGLGYLYSLNAVLLRVWLSLLFGVAGDDRVSGDIIFISVCFCNWNYIIEIPHVKCVT